MSAYKVFHGAPRLAAQKVLIGAKAALRALPRVFRRTFDPNTMRRAPHGLLRPGLLHVRGAIGPVHTPPLAQTRGCTHRACGARARRPPRGPARSVPRSIRRQSDPSGPHAPPFRPSRAAFCTPVEPAAAGRLGGAASTHPAAARLPAASPPRSLHRPRCHVATMVIVRMQRSGTRTCRARGRAWS